MSGPNPEGRQLPEEAVRLVRELELVVLDIERPDAPRHLLTARTALLNYIAAQEEQTIVHRKVTGTDYTMPIHVSQYIPVLEARVAALTAEKEAMQEVVDAAIADCKTDWQPNVPSSTTYRLYAAVAALTPKPPTDTTEEK